VKYIAHRNEITIVLSRGTEDKGTVTRCLHSPTFVADKNVGDIFFVSDCQTCQAGAC